MGETNPPPGFDAPMQATLSNPPEHAERSPAPQPEAAAEAAEHPGPRAGTGMPGSGGV